MKLFKTLLLTIGCLLASVSSAQVLTNFDTAPDFFLGSWDGPSYVDNGQLFVLEPAITDGGFFTESTITDWSQATLAQVTLTKLEGNTVNMLFLYVNDIDNNGWIKPFMLNAGIGETEIINIDLNFSGILQDQVLSWGIITSLNSGVDVRLGFDSVVLIPEPKHYALGLGLLTVGIVIYRRKFRD